jgi:hypothetical protein
MAIYDRETLQLIKSVVAHKAYFERLRLFRNTIATSSRYPIIIYVLFLTQNND